ncbi:17847_t:CDS:2 [Cetraspora pellucida]|uniref:17847_t:CDS:1 n=1 Tax=Cetraspora pellucida TaxID=1433469 RepID=A0ACA9MMK7_9GLOM|nr:17847_t:CDS:2 [Cetraspora pellucida]
MAASYKQSILQLDYLALLVLFLDENLYLISDIDKNTVLYTLQTGPNVSLSKYDHTDESCFLVKTELRKVILCNSSCSLWLYEAVS